MTKSMGKPPFRDETPPRMSRSVGSGAKGSTFSIPNGAKYGTGEGKAPTRMDRSVPASKGGAKFSRKAEGPGTTPRSDKGKITHAAKTYGVGGVSGAGSGGYGGS